MTGARTVASACVGVVAAAALGGCGGSRVNSTRSASDVVLHDRATAEVGDVLDALHGAAARADGAAYWGLFAPDAVFIGTDASERWTLDEFRRYADARFAAGKGWAYEPSARNVAVRGDVAWFDEVVTSEKYGACRGTGVLVRTAEGWKVSQYHLTLPIPNGLMPDMAERIKGYLAGRRVDGAS